MPGNAPGAFAGSVGIVRGTGHHCRWCSHHGDALALTG